MISHTAMNGSSMGVSPQGGQAVTESLPGNRKPQKDTRELLRFAARSSALKKEKEGAFASLKKGGTTRISPRPFVGTGVFYFHIKESKILWHY